MTWSIVAYDEKTGAFGATVATRAFAAGSFVPFVRAGVGAVGTQSLTNRYLGPATLEGLARGLSAQLAVDAHANALVDAHADSDGDQQRSAVHAAGHPDVDRFVQHEHKPQPGKHVCPRRRGRQAD